MGNPVFANMMEVSSKSMGGKSICEFPDVCFTPPLTPATPPGVPIPYPNTGMASDTSNGSSSVKIGGQEVMLKDRSYFKTSTGDEAGSAPKKGIITSTTKGKVFFIAWSMDVKFEGENVVRNLDMTTHNHASKIGTGSAATVQVATVAPSGTLAPATDPCKHPNDSLKKKYVVYIAPVVDKNGKPTGKVYVGRTRGPPGATTKQILAKRKSTHHRKDIGALQAVCETDSYAAVRGAEEKHQKAIAALGLSAKQINPISPRNKVKKQKYEDCAKQKNASCAVCSA